MEKWRLAWRDIAQRLPTHGLYRLWQACETDDSQLVQATTAISDILEPTAKDVACTGGCAIGYALAQDPIELGKKPYTVEQVEYRFGEITDLVQDESYSWDDFVDWFDGGKRSVVLAELLPECELELTRRAREMQPPMEFWEFTHYLTDKAEAEIKARTPETIARIKKEIADDRR